QGDGVVRRREEPDPSTRSYATGPADEEGARGDDDARQASRHSHAVCRARREGWSRDRRIPAATPGHGVPARSEEDRSRGRKGRHPHLSMVNYSTHETAVVKARLKRHPRFHVHFIPTTHRG